MGGASFGTFLPTRGEKYIQNHFIVPFSPCREKGTERAPPKGRTHGPPLWKPHPFSARACLSRVCAERNAVACGTSRCQVGASSVTRNGVGATPVAVNRLYGSDSSRRGNRLVMGGVALRRIYGNCGQEICLKLLTNQKRYAIIHHIIEMQRRNYSRFSVLSESRRMVRADTQNPVSLIPEQSLRTHTVVSGYGSSRYRRRS